MRIIHAVTDWFRVVLPFRGAGALWLLVYLICEAIFIGIEAQLGMLQPGQILAGNNPVAAMICIGAAFAYGLTRVVCFHPLWQPEYRRWLQSTPWTPRHALPQGPVLLQLQDLLIVAGLTLLSLRGEDVKWFAVPAAFAGSWLLISMVTFMVAGPQWLAYVLMAGCGVIIRYALTEPEVVGVTAGVMVVLAFVGHLLSIRSFHRWNLEWVEKVNWDAFMKSDGEAIQEAMRSKLLGWPYDQLAPTLETRRFLLTPLSGFLAALMVGWQFDCILTLFDHVAGGIPLFMLVIIARYGGFAFAGVRLVSYMDGYLPPMNVFARLAMGKWIIPRYDLVFLVPSIVVVTGWFGVGTLMSLGVPAVSACSATLGGTMFLVLTMPPDRAQFQLTGWHRIVPSLGQRQANEFVK